MEDKILNSIKLRPNASGFSDELIRDLINDVIEDVRTHLNYSGDEELPRGFEGIIKELTLIRINRIGAEGISSESNSGISQSYMNDIPEDIKRMIRRKRRLP